MTKAEHFGYIKDGKLHILNKNRMADDMRQFKDCDVTVTVKKRGKRSVLQNAYYWGCVVKEVQIRFHELGHDVETDDVHEYLKGRFHKEQIVTDHGEVIEVPRSTTEMNKAEFSEYVERIKQWAAESLDIYIPDPNQQTAFEL